MSEISKNESFWAFVPYEGEKFNTREEEILYYKETFVYVYLCFNDTTKDLYLYEPFFYQTGIHNIPCEVEKMSGTIFDAIYPTYEENRIKDIEECREKDLELSSRVYKYKMNFTDDNQYGYYKFGGIDRKDLVFPYKTTLYNLYAMLSSGVIKVIELDEHKQYYIKPFKNRLMHYRPFENASYGCIPFEKLIKEDESYIRQFIFRAEDHGRLELTRDLFFEKSNDYVIRKNIVSFNKFINIGVANEAKTALETIRNEYLTKISDLTSDYLLVREILDNQMENLYINEVYLEQLGLIKRRRDTLTMHDYMNRWDDLTYRVDHLKTPESKYYEQILEERPNRSLDDIDKEATNKIRAMYKIVSNSWKKFANLETLIVNEHVNFINKMREYDTENSIFNYGVNKYIMPCMKYTDSWLDT